MHPAVQVFNIKSQTMHPFLLKVYSSHLPVVIITYYILYHVACDLQDLVNIGQQSIIHYVMYLLTELIIILNQNVL